MLSKSSKFCLRPAESYDYVFEDQIEFIVDQYLQGTGPVSSSLLVFFLFVCLCDPACMLGPQGRPSMCLHGRIMPVQQSEAGMWASVCAPMQGNAKYEHRACAYALPCLQELEESKEDKMKREREAREAEQRSEFEQIQEARKQLPMFPYRQARAVCFACHCLRHSHGAALAPAITSTVSPALGVA